MPSYQLGRALFGLGKDRDAEGFIQEVIALREQNADAVLILANIHRQEKDYRALLADCDAFLRLRPEGPQAAKVKQTREAVRRMLTQKGGPSAEPPSKP